MFDWLNAPVQSQGGLFGGGAQQAPVSNMQVLAALLQDLGANYDKRPGTALAGVQDRIKRVGDQKQYQDVIGGLFGAQNINPVQSTPQITAPGQVQQRQLAGDYSQPTFGGAASGLGDAQAQMLAQFLPQMDPSAGLPLLVNSMASAQERQDKRGDRMQDRQWHLDDVANQPYELSPGQHRFVGGQEIASLPEKNNPNQPFNADGSPNKAYQAYEASKRQAEQAPQWANLDFQKEKLQSGIPDELALHDMAVRYNKGDKNAFGAMGRNPRAQTAAQNMISQVGRELGLTPEQISQNQQTFGAGTKAVQAFDTGKQGDTVRSLNVSVSHLETLRELGKALNNGDIGMINAAKQHFQEAFGVPAPANFDAARAIVADEVAKGVIGGQTAQSDRETLAETLRRSKSPQQIDGAIGTFQDLLGGQLRGLRQQYKSSTGRDDFNDKLFKETVDRLDPPKKQEAAAQLPNNARLQLKAGAVTTFANGQKWTLQNGQPVRVQ